MYQNELMKINFHPSLVWNSVKIGEKHTTFVVASDSPM